MNLFTRAGQCVYGDWTPRAALYLNGPDNFPWTGGPNPRQDRTGSTFALDEEFVKIWALSAVL